MGSDLSSAGPSLQVSTAKYASPSYASDAEVRTQLDRVRSSVPFRSSRRCVIFLDFVIHAALEGRLECLKERTIGIEVFGRDANYDTSQDPVVRGTATEVRKRLAQYYQIAGHEQELKIELPPGTYAPEFHAPAESVPKAAAPPPAAAVPAVAVRPRTRHVWWVAGAAGVVVLGALLSINRFGPKPQTVVDQFWMPMLESSEPVLLCVGQPKVYNLLGNLELDMRKKVLPRSRLTNDAANEKITTNVGSIIPNWDRYIALGDAMCLSEMAALFARRGHAYHIRGGGSTSFADLRENPAVLIGGFTNDWTLRLTGQLRFTFETSADERTDFVHDRRNPSSREWQLSNIWPAWTMPVDYAIVSRVLDPATGRVVVSAAGITHYGTAAAGEFLSNPEYLAEAIRQAPADWRDRNMQVVLSTRVIGGTAGPPRVLATYFW